MWLDLKYSLLTYLKEQIQRLSAGFELFSFAIEELTDGGFKL